MLAIIDYGMGNLRSVQKALEKVGCPVRVITSPGQIKGAKGLVLPGVGAFGRAMENLEKQKMVQPLMEWAAQDKPLLGICLGLQLLFTQSEETFPSGGKQPRGLNLIPGKVLRFSPGVKIPQIGWNQLEILRETSLLKDLSGCYFYFVHSYVVKPEDSQVIVGQAHYGQNFPGVVQKGNIYGIQFHPEKSSSAGMKILKKFGELAGVC